MMIFKYICKLLILGFEIFSSIYLTATIPFIWVGRARVVWKVIKTILCLFVIGANSILITNNIKELQK